MENAGLLLGSASLSLHFAQGVFHLLRHLKVSSDCCGRKSSFEIETGNPPLRSDESQPKNKDSQ